MRCATLGLTLAASAVVAISCAPRLRPLPGAPTAAALPRSELPRGHQRIVFQWTLEDPDISARGEGAARTAWPDSVRLDFFLAGGVGAGAAVLIGTELRLPPRAGDIVRRLIPPVPLLWAALGRLAVPAMADTNARVDGDTLRADIGVPVAWRVTFIRDTLRRLERVDGGRVVEWVERVPPASPEDAAAGAPASWAGGRLRYRNEVSRRQLDLNVTRVDITGAFDPIIWVFE